MTLFRKCQIKAIDFVCTALVRFFFAFLSKDLLQSVKQIDIIRATIFRANWRRLFTRNNTPKYIILDLNICSLSAKFDRFLAHLDDLRAKNFYIVAITLQEVWKYSKIFEIPGFNFYHSTRTASLGGGTGIYICNNISVLFSRNLC